MPDAPDYLFDALVAGLMSRARGLSRAKAEDAVRYVLDPERPTTIRGMMEAAGVSRPTAIKYRDLIVSAMENGPEVLNIAKNGPEVPPPSTEWVEANSQHTAEDLKQRRADEAPIGSSEMQRIINRTIRRLDRDEGNATQIKALAELAIKYQGLQAETEERIIDKGLVLGEEGLSAIGDQLAARISTFLHHRLEIPAIYAAIAGPIWRTVQQDRAEGLLPVELSGVFDSSALPDNPVDSALDEVEIEVETPSSLTGAPPQGDVDTKEPADGE